MASSYNNLGIELQATGENAGTWGTKTNTNLNLIAETWGWISIDMADADVTLAMTSGEAANGRNYIIELTGTLAGTRVLDIPAQAGSPAANIEKAFIIVDKTNRSGSAYTLTFKVTGATGIALRPLPADKSSAPVITYVYDNGSDIVDASKDVAISFTNGQYIADSNANELLTFGVVSSAVNEVKVTNAATGTAGPIIEAQGETNVNLQLRPAGSGVITVGSSAANATLTSKGAHDLILSTNEGSSSGTITITDASNGNITLTPDGTGVVTATDAADATAAVKIAGKETIWVPALAMYPTTTNGCAAVAQVEGTAQRPEIKACDFDPSSDEYAQFAVCFPKSWDEGTVTFQSFWSVTGTNAGTVCFQLAGGSIANDAAIDTAFGTQVANTPLAASGTASDLMVNVESGAVTIANAAVDTWTSFQINRDISADDQTADARLLGIKLFFTTDAANDA